MRDYLGIRPKRARVRVTNSNLSATPPQVVIIHFPLQGLASSTEGTRRLAEGTPLTLAVRFLDDDSQM
ncbi:MAG: hypothetical protein H0U76_28140 [Ktedonobacteraceae bacterium]|nr:hypothetical protein [Ktedonobacteraceae bacterium]